MLDGTREHENIPGVRLYLDGVFEEILSVVRIARVDVGPWSNGGAAILFCESVMKDRMTQNNNVTLPYFVTRMTI